MTRFGFRPRATAIDVAQRVVGVGVVHDHDERLAFVDALEAAGHRAAGPRSRARSSPARCRRTGRRRSAARMLYTLIRPISGDSTGKRILPYCTSKRRPWKPEEICRARRSASCPRPYQNTSRLGIGLDPPRVAVVAIDARRSADGGRRRLRRAAAWPRNTLPWCRENPDGRASDW